MERWILIKEEETVTGPKLNILGKLLTASSALMAHAVVEAAAADRVRIIFSSQS